MTILTDTRAQYGAGPTYWRLDIENDIGGEGPGTRTRFVTVFTVSGTGALVAVFNPQHPDPTWTCGISNDDLDLLTDHLIARREARG